MYDDNDYDERFSTVRILTSMPTMTVTEDDDRNDDDLDCDGEAHDSKKR